ncbi:BORE2 protein, partial [Caloenas nicobarica]|nr:BORE2 protein [Caloenas nicobarica]
MSPRRAAGGRRSPDSGVGPERGAALREKKEQRLALFLRDFDQQAKEHIREMKGELSSLLQTAEKAFAVELLKMPVAVRNMSTKDFLSERVPWGSRTALCSSRHFFPCLSNVFLVKVTTIVQYEDAEHTSAKKMSKKVSLF